MNFLGSNSSDPFPFEAENLFCTFFTFEWLVRLLPWPHWDHWDHWGCGRWVVAVEGQSSASSQVCQTPWFPWVISHVPIFHITQPLDSIRYMVFFMATISGDVQYSQVMGHLTTPGFHTFHLFIISPIKRYQKPLDPWCKRAADHLRFAFQRKVLALTDAWPLWLAGSRRVEGMCSFSDGADLFRDLFGDLLTMFITNPMNWLVVNHILGIIIPTFIFFRGVESYYKHHGHGLISRGSSSPWRSWRSIDSDGWGDDGDGRRIRPEVCIRHALGVLNDRGDLDYDTWMRLELVLEDQWIL